MSSLYEGLLAQSGTATNSLESSSAPSDSLEVISSLDSDKIKAEKKGMVGRESRRSTHKIDRDICRKMDSVCICVHMYVA